jgi:hypothetical protein
VVKGLAEDVRVSSLAQHLADCILDAQWQVGHEELAELVRLVLTVPEALLQLVHLFLVKLDDTLHISYVQFLLVQPLLLLLDLPVCQHDLLESLYGEADLVHQLLVDDAHRVQLGVLPVHVGLQIEELGVKLLLPHLEALQHPLLVVHELPL